MFQFKIIATFIALILSVSSYGAANGIIEYFNDHEIEDAVREEINRWATGDDIGRNSRHRGTSHILRKFDFESEVEILDVQDDLAMKIGHSTIGALGNVVNGSFPEWISDTDFYKLYGQVEGSISDLDGTFSLECRLTLHESKGIFFDGRFDKTLKKRPHFKDENAKKVRTIKGKIIDCNLTHIETEEEASIANPYSRIGRKSTFDFGEVILN